MAETVELTTNDDGEDSFASFFALLDSGQIKSLADLQSRLESPAEKTLVKAASVVNSFDEALFNEALQLLLPPGSPAVSFADFVRNSNVEEVPRTVRVYRIKDTARQEALKQWAKEISSDLTVADSPFFKKLLTHYNSDDDWERLGLLVITKSEMAATVFRNLFEAADKRFDLAGCNDILKSLNDRLDFLTDELKTLLDEKRQYLNARNLFARDYYQTAFYYARNSVVKSFQELLKADAKPKEEWIFQLYAKGGMGKTMFVKWLLARHCVPNQIPIARIDFDFIHLPTAVRYPTLILLAIANQLNMQIPGSVFDEYLLSNFRFLSLLRPPDSALNEERQRAQKQFHDIEQQLRDSIAGRFKDALNESSLKNNVIVVFDTMEEMSLSRRQTLDAVLEKMKQIHRDYDGLRLLLSGRYKLEDRSTRFKNEFLPFTVTHELEPFARKEARAYLKQNRSVTNNAIVNAIVKKCKEEPSESRKKKIKKGSTPIEEFNPFKLSLFVDLYQQREVETAADILSYPKTDIEYLIERVVRRIKEPTVQWLLRYAAIPRQFTYEIFNKVLASHMEEELIKRRQWDQVNQKFPEGAESFNNQENWKEYKPGRTKKLDRLAIWNSLRKYASGYSFISFDTGDESAPRLQPEVTVPMRRLLEEQDVFPKLHQDAEAFFFKKAARQPDLHQKAQHLSETIYHRFQREGAAASEYWRDLLESDESLRSPRVRKMLAEEILGKDYIDDLGEPVLKRTGAVMVERETLREAYLRTIEATVAMTANLKRSDRPSAWEEISQRLEELQALDRKHPKLRFRRTIKLDSSLLRRLAALLRQTRPNFKSAIRLLRQAVTSPGTEQMAIALRLQLADALAIEDQRQCVTHYNRVLKLVKSAKVSQVTSSGVLLKLGLWHQQKRNFAVAQRIYRNVLVRAEKDKYPGATRDALRYLADVSLELGHYDEALRLLDKAIKADGRKAKPTIVDALLVSQIKGRSLYQPLQALIGVEPFLDTDMKITERAALKELTGDLNGQLMCFDVALELLEEAKDLWVSAPNTDSADRARILRIELQLFEIGNFNEADYLLNVAEDLSTESTTEVLVHLKTLRIFLAHRRGDHRLALRLWKNLTKNKKLTADTANHVHVLATGLSLGFGNTKTVSQFAKLLGTVDPVARLSLLRAFEFGYEAFIVTPAQRRALVKLVTIPLHGKDLIPHVLQCANMLVWCGADSTAKRYLDRAGREALRVKNSFAYRKVLLAKDRLTLNNPRTDALSKSNFLKDYAAYHVLCGAALAEQARRYFRESNRAASKAAVGLSLAKFSEDQAVVNKHAAALDELAGRLARNERKSALATTFFRSALSKFKKLGDKFMEERLDVVREVVERPIERDATDLLMEMKATPRQLQLEFYADDLKRSSGWIRETSYRPLTKLVKAEIRDRSTLYKLSKLLVDHTKETRNELGDIIVNTMVQLDLIVRNRKIGDFHLDSLSPALAKIPWELATYKNKSTLDLFRYFYRSAEGTSHKSQSTKWLQLAFNDLGANTDVDGVFGPMTQAALDALRRKNKWPDSLKGAALMSKIGELLVKHKPKRDTRALIIRSKDSKSRTRSSSMLDWIYNDCYFNVQTIDPVVNLKSMLAKFQPDVIHIECAFREVPGSGEIYLDFQQTFGESVPKFQPLSPSLLNHVLATAPDTKLRPLVILDARAPSTITEAVHQLFYRNAYAAQLFQAGQVSAVIAMGLTLNFDLYQKQIFELVSNLSNTRTFGEITNSLRSSSQSSNLADKIAAEGVALFTNEPWLTVLTPERR